MSELSLQNATLEIPKTRSEQVYELLRERILDQEIKPGDILMEVPVSDALNVSRTPVREAFRLLQHEGLVRKNPKGGVQVTELTLEELQEVSDLRTVLEVYAIQLACERITEKEIAELEDVITDISKALERSAEGKEPVSRTLGALSVKFHGILYDAAKSDHLKRTLDVIRLPILRYLTFSLETQAQRERSSEEHKMIVDLLKKRDKPALKKLMKKHMKDSGNAIARKLKSSEL
jgi:DNA-binding GntR family transcriptional regulator